jgi:hypothetical protein
MLVAPAASATFCNNQPLTRQNEIPDQFSLVVIIDGSPRWNSDDQVISRATAAVGRSAILSCISKEILILMKMAECVESRDDLEDDIPTSTAIPTVRTTARTVLFTVHMHHSIAAFARRDFYLN